MKDLIKKFEDLITSEIAVPIIGVVIVLIGIGVVLQSSFGGQGANGSRAAAGKLMGVAFGAALIVLGGILAALIIDLVGKLK